MGVEEFGDRLRRLREGAGLSQHQLAAKAQVSFQSIQSWESKKSSTIPRRGNVIKVAQTLNTDPDELLTLLDQDPLDDDERAALVDVQRQRFDELWPQLSDYQRQTLVDFLDSMCGKRPQGAVNLGVRLAPGTGEVPPPRADNGNDSPKGTP